MVIFKDNRNHQTKQAYEMIEQGDKILIRFTEGGKQYPYAKENIEILQKGETSTMPFTVYTFQKPCYRCQKMTTILTYLKDEQGNDLQYPWDSKKLQEQRSLEATLQHMQFPDIEWYPIITIGSDEALDQIMLQKFPNQIKEQYSKTQSRMYPMNVCKNCGAKQGEFFIYQELNKIIQKREQLATI